MKTTQIKNLGLFLVVILMIFARSMSAQAVVYAMGNVSDLNGTPIANQLVYLSDDTISMNMAMATTNANGDYTAVLTTLSGQGILFVATEDCNFNLILNTHPFNVFAMLDSVTSNFTICVSNTLPCTLLATVSSNPNGLNATVTGGTPPYAYLWDNGATSTWQPFYQNWCVTIIDANGCDTMICDTSLLTPCTLPGAYVTSSPNGLSAGTITMPPNALVYVWSNGVVGNWTPFYQNWCVQIIDSVSGCDTIICDTSSVPCNLLLTVYHDTITNTLTPSTIGGTPPYNYTSNNGGWMPPYPNTPGWCIIVADANGCIATVCDSSVVNPSNCIDPNLIDSTVGCFTIYDPVCGCDSVTYSNPCVAENYAGVTSYTYGACGSIVTFCQANFTSTQVSASDSTFFINLFSGTNASTSYFWDFGDNSFSTDENPIHLFAQSGTYYVCLTIMDSTTNCYDTFCDYLTVVVAGGNGCQAYFWSSLVWAPLAPPNTYEFFDFSSGNASNWLWSFGDGTTSTQQNPVHTYSPTGSGFYQVCLTIEEYDPLTQALICTDTYCDSIYMLNQFSCQADFYAQNLGNNEATFTNTSYPQSGLMSTVDIDYGDGNIDYNISSFVNHTYASAGTYYVCVTVNSMDSSQTVTCTDTYCDSVTVTSGTIPCQADFCSILDSSVIITQNPNGTTTITMSNVIYFCDLSTPVNMIQSWQWDMGDNGAGQYLQNTSSTSQAPVYEFDTTGVYNVCLTIVTIGGQCTSTTCDSVDFSMMQGGPISVIEEINAFQELKLYPNPASDRMTVNLMSNTIGDLSIQLVNMMGQTLSSSTLTIFNGAINHSLDVSEIANGVYSVEVVLNGEKQHQRVVISR